LARVQVQSGLASAPEHVVGAARVLALEEIAQLALRQPGAIGLAGDAVAQRLGGERAVAPEGAVDHRHGQCTVAAEDLSARFLAAPEDPAPGGGGARPSPPAAGEKAGS